MRVTNQANQIYAHICSPPWVIAAYQGNGTARFNQLPNKIHKAFKRKLSFSYIRPLPSSEENAAPEKYNVFTMLKRMSLFDVSKLFYYQDVQDFMVCRCVELGPSAQKHFWQHISIVPDNDESTFMFFLDSIQESWSNTEQE